MLKNVVFPAPFGPMRLTIEPSGTVKSTSFTAVRPPNSLRTLWAVSRSAISVRHVIERLVGHALVELRGPSRARYQALRSEEHHHQQDDPEDPELVLRDVDGGAPGLERGSGRAEVGVQPAADVREALAVEVGEEGGAEDDAEDVPHPAQDDHAEDEDGDVEEEVAREGRALEARVEGARDAAEEGAGRVRPRLRAHERHAHRGGGGLVLADRDPRAAEGRVAQPPGAEGRQEPNQARRPVEEPT